ncbi:MAG: hypothetical protein CVU67_02585 [Deltaproteobacteria bacterium HGW-Deltaproteobacteria-24]|nr:MAG: hypothetical protein CVU67_02585 [Deltaproteobacteria bacterium HGW-Deltaproteobacteria-24]
MDNLIFLFFLFVALELFEANWQKSESLYGVIYNNFLVYQKSLFTFFILNPTFFYVVFLTIYLNTDSFLMYAMMIIKFVDVAFKITMMKKLSQGQKMEEIMPVNVKMGFVYRYMNVVIYPLTFLFAINAI